VKYLKSLPGEERAWAFWDELLSSRSAEKVFSKLYTRREWGPNESSGPGSSHVEAKPYLELANGLIELSGWQRVIDLGCGDGYIATQLDAAEVIGVDCYPIHIARLREQWPERGWLQLDLDRDREKLPEGDVAFLKDVLLHWPNHLVCDWLTWARKSGKWNWVICTQDNLQEREGQDCLLGGLRPLDIEKEPLKNLNLVRLCDFMKKSVLLLKCERNRAVSKLSHATNIGAENQRSS
jgi:SAM-dependent methyltransferase